MNQCSECHKKTICVPSSWHTDDAKKVQKCPSCFNYSDPDAKILTFDMPRGGLWSRWVVEGFGKDIMVLEDENKIFVLAPLLDQHNKQLILQGEPDNEVVPDELLEDYRNSGAIYEMDVKQFWTEMWGFY